MFIDVTRYGADRSLRLAAAAIAYIDYHPQGCIVRLIGGESLHLEQSTAEIEERIEQLLPELIPGELLAAPFSAETVAPPSRVPEPAIDLERELAAVDASEKLGIVPARDDAEQRAEIEARHPKAKRK